MNTIEQTAKTPEKAQEATQPDFVKRIGKNTYKVKIYFNPNSKETITDKIMRLLQNEVNQSTKE